MSSSQTCRFRLSLLILLLLSSWAALAEESSRDLYRQPSEELRRLVEVPSAPQLILDPTNRHLLLFEREDYLGIEDLSREELKLAGLRFHPRSRASLRRAMGVNLSLLSTEGGEPRAVTGLPEGARLTEVAWSPNGERLAVVNVTETESQLWLVDVSQARAFKVPDLKLNGANWFEVRWLPDGLSLVVLGVPKTLPALSPEEKAPTGPKVLEHRGGKASARTYQDLLQTPRDEELFEHYLTSQVYRVEVEELKVKPLSSPRLFTDVSPSPDGRYLLVSYWERPFSRTLPRFAFPLKSVLWDQRGEEVAVIRELPLRTHSPPELDAVRPGPRQVQWRTDADSTLFWVEALDGGDPKVDVEFRDQLFLWSPGEDSPSPWHSLKLRSWGVDWGDDETALIHEGWTKDRRTRTYLVSPGRPSESEPKVLFDRSSEDRYSDPGRPLYRQSNHVNPVLKMSEDGRSIYLSGQGASPEGDRPFLRKLDLQTGEIEDMYRSPPPNYERPYQLLQHNEHGTELLVLRESLTEPPNLYRYRVEAKEVETLTAFPDPTPELRDVRKEMIRYQRADGVDLSATLYTPPGYDKDRDGRLPLLVWAYPREFKSADSAGQVTGSPYRFFRPYWGGPLFFVLRGYAVLENPSFPILGEGEEEPNDTYIEQLVMNAEAAIDAVVELGIADRDRCAIGGHSYGAFTAANLLAHSDLFRAGIARSGAFNRTLTPFGFQSEERTFWEAPETYMAMSPFTHADRIVRPLLLIHGEEDPNSGTHLMQSERLFQAIKGLGGQAKLVILPKEGHGYQAKESVLHTLYEMEAWLEQHVK